MLKEVIADEEFEQIEAETRHRDLVRVLERIAARGDDETLERLLKQTETLISVISRKNFTTDLAPLIDGIGKKDFITDLRPLIMEIAKGFKELKMVMEKPRVYTVERTNLGFIKTVTMERERPS